MKKKTESRTSKMLRGGRIKAFGLLLSCALMTGICASSAGAGGTSWWDFFGTYSEDDEEAPYQTYEWADDSDQNADEQKETAKPEDQSGSKKQTEKADQKKQTEKDAQKSSGKEDQNSKITVEEDGEYTSKDEVAAYLNEYGHLPDNFITKNEAKDLGWVSSKGNLNDAAPGKSIGGDRFGNNEGLLPTEKGRKYFECDIDYKGGRRNSKRIVYSNDGLIFYTEDHYETFEQLYPAEE